MEPQQWNDGLNHLDPDLVEEYIEIKDKKRAPKRPFWVATVAAALALTIGLGMLAGNGILPTNAPSLETLPATQPTTGPYGVAPTVPTRPVVTNPPTTPPQEPVIVPLKNLVYAPVYPEMPQYPNPKDYTQAGNLAFERAVGEWEAERKKQYLQPAGYADSLTDYFQKSISQFLRGDDNQVYSPLNVYLAMAMLAETADGNSRQQILDLFGLDTIEQLREQINHLWNAHYCDDGVTDTVLANSIWMDDSYRFNRETTKLLANRYHAASFSGDMLDPAMSEQLQSWINENTGGLLTNEANSVRLDDNPNNAFALASTVYFTASWDSKFPVKNTKDAIFHSPTVDKKVPFMNKNMIDYYYYWGENYGAVELALTGDNSMWLILPDEGYTVADILASDEYLQMTLNPVKWENKRKMEINLSVPKFDVTENQDLKTGLIKMGVTDVFNSTAADFSPLFTDSADRPFVQKVNHAVRVTIDEEGCKGAAFTVIIKAGMAMPPEVQKIDFILDRPFMFVVSSQDNLPLFAGIVNEP